MCNHRDENGLRPLHWAAEHGHVAIAKIIQNYTVTGSINECDDDGYSAMHHAAANNHLSMVEYLISVCANVNHVCDYGDGRYGPSSLHVAVARGHLEMVKLLVRLGADVDCNNSDYRMIFGDTPLAWAVKHNQRHVVVYLIDSGCDMDKADNDGNTPLHKAGYLGFVGIVELLVTRGAKVNIMNCRRENVLEIVRRVGCQEANSYLAGS